MVGRMRGLGITRFYDLGSETVAQLIRQNVPDEANQFWLPPLASPEKFSRAYFARSPPAKERKPPALSLFPRLFPHSQTCEPAAAAARNRAAPGDQRRRRRKYSGRRRQVPPFLSPLFLGPRQGLEERRDGPAAADGAGHLLYLASPPLCPTHSLISATERRRKG